MNRIALEISIQVRQSKKPNPESPPKPASPGYPAACKQSCDQVVRIPIGGTVESLNASVLAALCLYETVRQRGV
jgi:hypothetical protein